MNILRIAFVLPDKEMPWDSVHLGIGYVAAYAKENFLVEDIKVFRTCQRSEKDLISFLNLGWDVIGIPLTTPMIKEANGICEKIKSISSSKIVVGGAEVTSIEEEILRQMPLVDNAIMGEGEITFLELLQCFSGEINFSSVKGLIYRNEKGAICKNSPRPFEKDLSKFPFPDRTLFDYEYNFHSIIGTRGCPYHCTFCNSSSNWGHSYRVKPPKDVFREVEYIISLYGKDKYISFNDDAFNIKKDWVVEVCKLLEKLNARFWIRGLRAGLITAEVAEALMKAGVFGAACGVESADNDALRAMRKATTIEDILLGVKTLRSAGIDNVTGQFIIGNQGDTLETVKKSIECGLKHFKKATFGIAYPIPHTFLYDYVKENNLFLKEPVPIKFKGNVVDWMTFDTPNFSVSERLKAVNLAIEAKVYHNMQYD